jgi:RNase P/RNase MRP subunit p29
VHKVIVARQGRHGVLGIRAIARRLFVLGAAFILAACHGHSHHSAPSDYTVAGSITGLSTNGLVLQNNGGDSLSVPANASDFQFATAIAAGGDYAVTVATQPTGLTCTVSHGTGTNVREAIIGITVVCNAITHTIAGTISGLTTNGLVLRNNGSDDLTIAANATSFQFVTPVAAGGGYNVTAFAQPSGLTCSISNGVGSNVNTAIHNINIACSATTLTVGGTITGLTGSGLVLQNNGGDNLSIAANATAFEFATPVAYGGGYAVTVFAQPAGQFCSIVNASNTATVQVSDVALTCAQTTLTPNVSTLSLSVNDVGLDAALTGTSRQITISNNGSIAAVNVAISYPVWPTGTTAFSTCGSTLAAAASCTITLTPGSSATSNCGTGIAPTAGTITVTADDAPTSTIDAVVLSYGCIYQAGYIFAIDDTTPNTSSIGGKVISLVDQAPPYISSGAQAGSLVWSSNGASGNPGDVSYDLLPGIDETSSLSSGSPTYASSQISFNNSYSNTGIFPFPSSSSFTACNANSDGACNTSNIATFYNQYVTNYGQGGAPYTLSAGPTTTSNYAAGLCSQTIGGYSDWYLPAICEMGPDTGGSGCAVGTANVLNNVSSLIGDPSAGSPSTSCAQGANCVAGYYWSSTQFSSLPEIGAWIQFSDSSGGSSQLAGDKNNQFGVRCARALTQ